ncbi:MACPF domain-containing protein [Cardamine amara subsp. amara]|uniref:MACPF domain-containing protein n=1 Tax=Cardamine amara subsp. amara TaxID=228776 RepID=A0ABD1BS88_CARAN
MSQNDVAFIITGAQLEVKKHGSESVLHLRLRFTKVSDHYVVQKDWVHGPTGTSSEIGNLLFLELAVNEWECSSYNMVNKDKNEVNLDSSVFPGGPPVPGE